MKFLKRIWQLIFPPKRFFPPKIEREDEKWEIKDLGKADFFEPISDKQIFESSTDVDDFLNKLNEIKK